MNLDAEAFWQLIDDVRCSPEVRSRFVSIGYRANDACDRVEFDASGDDRHTDFVVFHKMKVGRSAASSMTDCKPKPWPVLYQAPQIQETMMRMLITLVLISACCTNLLSQDDLKAFPAADEGFQRHVLRLPEANDEDLMKVEIVVGKTVEIDSVNNYFFGGRIEPVNIEGWGYTRYLVKEIGPMAGTLIGVAPGSPKEKRFISLGGEPYLVRYNNRLPLVVYVPDGTQVRYRIWRADKETKAVEKE